MSYMGGASNNGVDWDYYDKYEELSDKYLPRRGEGDTLATQICTAVNKLVYKWYNDGDVYDNTHKMAGWWNDLSSYANWLARYVPGAKEILDRIYVCSTHGEYEHILKDLTDLCFDESDMKRRNRMETNGTVYNCVGDYVFSDKYEDEDEDEYDEDYDDDEMEDD